MFVPEFTLAQSGVEFTITVCGQRTWALFVALALLVAGGRAHGCECAWRRDSRVWVQEGHTLLAVKLGELCANAKCPCDNLNCFIPGAYGVLVD